VRTERFGEQAARRADNWSRFDQGLVDWLMESVWGGILSRPGLNRRDREMITVAALTALGKQRELQYHVAGALAAGVSKEEIIEIIIQMAIYAGVPACWEGLAAAEPIFQERGLM
jgi:4-carboxymuconolactone decarboxylase